MGKKNRKRMSKSLRSPFSKESLQTFAEEIPEKSTVRIAGAESYHRNILKPIRGSNVFLEAVWWEKIPTPKKTKSKAKLPDKSDITDEGLNDLNP